MKQDEGHKYDDIILLPHHISKRHPQMTALNRAAQFSPFAALSGHGDAIREIARLTDSFVELDEGRKEQIDGQLWLIRDNLDSQLEIEATYFQPDEKKHGGVYVTKSGRVKKIDEYSRRIIFTDGGTIPIERLFSIRGELFGKMDWLDA